MALAVSECLGYRLAPHALPKARADCAMRARFVAGLDAMFAPDLVGILGQAVELLGGVTVDRCPRVLRVAPPRAASHDRMSRSFFIQRAGAYYGPS